MARIPNYAPPGSLLDKRLKHRRVEPGGPGQRQPPRRNPKHLANIRRCPCLTCPAPVAGEAAHLRMPCPRLGKKAAGLGSKPSDHFAVPLCHTCHMDQHTRGEAVWWEEKGIDPFAVAEQLTARSGNVEAMTEVILRERRTA